jgi:hypothetical protein
MKPRFHLSALCLLVAVVALIITFCLLTARHNAQLREMTAQNAQLREMIARHNAQLRGMTAFYEAQLESQAARFGLQITQQSAEHNAQLALMGSGTASEPPTKP